jgi:hypothetical protein
MPSIKIADCDPDSVISGLEVVSVPHLTSLPTVSCH